MNNLDLIEVLKKETGPTKIEAKKVVALFFDEMSNALANGDRVEIKDYAHFTSSNTKMPGGIRKPENRPRLNPRSCRFSSVGRN